MLLAASQKWPRVQAPEQLAFVSPGVLPNRPASHSIGLEELAGQKVPRLHCCGCVEPPAHQLPAGHGMHASIGSSSVAASVLLRKDFSLHVAGICTTEPLGHV